MCVSMCDLQLTRPIFERPKSVSLMCPSDVINKLERERESKDSM